MRSLGTENAEAEVKWRGVGYAPLGTLGVRVTEGFQDAAPANEGRSSGLETADVPLSVVKNDQDLTIRQAADLAFRGRLLGDTAITSTVVNPNAFAADYNASGPRAFEIKNPRFNGQATTEQQRAEQREAEIREEQVRLAVNTRLWEEIAADLEAALQDENHIFHGFAKAVAAGPIGASLGMGMAGMGHSGRSVTQAEIDAIASQHQAPAAPIIELLVRGEAGGSYDKLTGGRDVGASQSSLRDVMELQSVIYARGGQTAIGGPQFIRSTLAGLVQRYNVDTSLRFSPELQNALATRLLEEMGLEAFLKGDLSLEKFQYKIAGTWAAAPMNASGVGRYDGYNGNMARISAHDMRAALLAAREIYQRQLEIPIASHNPAQSPAPTLQ